VGVKSFISKTGITAVAICLAALTFAPAKADPVVNVKPKTDVSVALHKALYSFKMVSVQSGAGISGISGTMYYEQDDNCDAWTTDHRFRVEYQYPERRAVANTSHYVAFESKDQAQFYFSSERQEDGEMTEQLRGSIDKKDDGTAEADYSRPDDLSYKLPKGYLLPTQHTNELIRRARIGEKFFDAIIFDGTDADGPVEINAHIGKKLTADELKAISGDKLDRSLLSPEAWHVRMAVFPLKEKDGMTPSYEMDVNMHDNGVISYSLVDYKSFKVEQKLIALEKIPAKTCPN
jgi:EipB-like